jgi:hypothetical protein
MRIRRGAWHLRVFLQAYVRDRGWIDAFWETGNAPKDLPEIVTVREYAASLKAENPKGYQNIMYPVIGMSQLTPELREKQEHFQKLLREEERAVNEWRSAEWQRHHERRVTEVETRLYAGRMSLCPYFWSVVFALVFYYPVVRPTRGAWRVATFFVPVLAWLATRILVALLVGLVGYGLYAGRNTIPQIPSNVVQGVKSEYADYQQRQEAKAKWEAEEKRLEQQRLAVLLEWERTHPEEMRQRREAEAERLRQIATYETERSVRDRQRFWADAKDAAGKLGTGLVYLVLGIAGLVVVGAILVLILGGIWALISTPFVALGKLLADSALARRLAQARATWRQFWADTRELVGAFIKAKKERVCPFLMIEDGSEQH